MAFDAAGMNCIAVGPTKLYIYNTGDTLNSTTVKATTYGFNSTNCPGLAVGDIILCAHATATLFAPIRITAMTATTCTYTGITALA